MKKCPRCSEVLFRRRAGEVEVDGCGGCGGAFLDKGELGALMETPALLASLDSLFRQGMQASLAPVATNLCPKCSTALRPYMPPSLAGITLDVCPGCQGSFLDHGEATAIAKRKGFEPVVPSPSARPSRPLPELTAAPPPGGDGTATAGLPLVRGMPVSRDRFESAGLFASIDRAFRFFSNAVAMAIEAPALLLPLLLAAGAQIVFGTAAIAVVQKLSLFEHLGRSSQHHRNLLFQEHGLLALVLIGALTLGAVLSHQIVMGMTVSMVDAWLKGRTPTLAVAFEDVKKNLGGLLGLAFADLGAKFAAGTVRSFTRRSGFIGSMVGGAIASSIETGWEILSFLLLPIIMIEDVGVTTAWDRVKEIHRRNLMQIGLGAIGLRAIQSFTGFLILLPMIAAVVLGASLGPTGWALLAEGMLVAVALLGTLNAFVSSAYYTCLYLWAAEVERAQDPAMVMVPLPLARALAA